MYSFKVTTYNYNMQQKEDTKRTDELRYAYCMQFVLVLAMCKPTLLDYWGMVISLINGHLKWEELQALTANELQELEELLEIVWIVFRKQRFAQFFISFLGKLLLCFGLWVSNCWYFMKALKFNNFRKLRARVLDKNKIK